MPIEVNRINKECPKCKSPQIFDTGKNFFCGKCLNEFPKAKDANQEPVMVEVREPVPIKFTENGIIGESENTPTEELEQ